MSSKTEEKQVEKVETVSKEPVVENTEKETKKKRKFTWTDARRDSFQKCIEANKKMRGEKMKKKEKEKEDSKQESKPVTSSSSKQENGKKRKSHSSSSSSSEDDDDSLSLSSSSSSDTSSSSSSSSDSSHDSAPRRKKRKSSGVKNTTKSVKKKIQLVKQKDMKRVLRTLHKIKKTTKAKRNSKGSPPSSRNPNISPIGSRAGLVYGASRPRRGDDGLCGASDLCTILGLQQAFLAAWQGK